MAITIDDGTRIVSLAAVKIKRPPAGGGAPLDLARDTVLLVDPKTHRPVAMIRPIEGPPRLVTQPEPSPASAGESPYARGPLSEAHKEQLQRLWIAHPTADPARIASLFAKATGRAISSDLAVKHRPAEGPGAGDPSPEEIAASRAAFRAGKRPGANGPG